MPIKIGDTVECEFLDHVEDGGPPIRFAVWGRLFFRNKEYIEILCWDYASPTEERHPHNQKKYSIVRSTIVKFNRMQPAP